MSGGDFGASRRLDLDEQQLTLLPESIGRMADLEKLDLRWNDVGPLPDWLQRRAQDGCTVYF